MYKLIIFDFDGTLANTETGIIDSHVYAHKEMNKKIPSIDRLKSVIGGALMNVYISDFGFSPEEAKIAISIYRNYYARHGILSAELYPGIPELLSTLKQKEFVLAIASLKAEIFVRKMIINLNISQYMDIVYGVDLDDKRTKSDLIKLCMDKASVTPDSTLMIGDSITDYKGAVLNSVNFIGVKYGYGFQTKKECEGKILFENVDDLRRYLCYKSK